MNAGEMLPARTSFRERPATSATISACTLAFVGLFAWTLVRAPARGESILDAALASLWQLDDIEAITRLGALADARVWLDGEWWRVATAGLLHGSWLHLGLNMMGLWSVGQWTEKALGGLRSTGVFVASSLIGCLASLAWAEAPLVVGASAGIFGLAGALVVVRKWGRPAMQDAVAPVSARTLAGWLAFWLVLGFALPWVFGLELIAQAGHIGGLLGGVLLGLMVGRGKAMELAGWASAIAVALALGVAGRAPTWRFHYHVFVGFESLQRGEFERASEAFEQGLAMAPDDPELANAVAWALVEAGAELDQAEVLVRGSIEQDPERADYQDTLGWILCKQGRTAEGVEVLELARSLDASIEEVGVHLEQCGSVAMFHVEPAAK